MTQPARLVPATDLHETIVGEETVVLHLGNDTYFSLDALGTEIWGLLKQGLDAAAIRDRIAADYGTPVAIVEADLHRFLDDLRAHDLLRPA